MYINTCIDAYMDISAMFSIIDIKQREYNALMMVADTISPKPSGASDPTAATVPVRSDKPTTTNTTAASSNVSNKENINSNMKSSTTSSTSTTTNNTSTGFGFILSSNIATICLSDNPPHQFSFPANSPLYRGAAYSARAALEPEANSVTLESAAALTTSLVAGGPDLESGPALAGEEGTTKTFAFSSPSGPLPGSMDSGDGGGFGSDEGPSKTQEARDSPESSDQSGSPPDRTKGFFSDKNFEFARKLFSTDAQRASLQVFPSVTMVRISVTDSGAGISKVSIMRVYAH